MTSYKGIDYSLGRSNYDRESGIRYGIISANALTEWLWESVDSIYDPYCPKCGNPAVDIDAEGVPDLDDLPTHDEDDNEIESDWEDNGRDYACLSCRYSFDSDEAYPDFAEPSANVIDTDGIKGIVDDSNDVWVFKSPYFTYAQFCSPCAPGACHLENPLDEPDENNRCYCLGPDWFRDDEPCPYPVYSIETGERVYYERVEVECSYCGGTGKRTVEEFMSLSGLKESTGREMKVGDEFPCNVCEGTGKRTKKQLVYRAV